MVSFRKPTIAIAGFLTVAFVAASESVQAQNWTDLQGQIVWKGKAPGQAKLNFANNKDAAECAKDKAPFEEHFIVNPANNGLKNVVIWIRPAGAAKAAAFPPALIHRDLKKPAVDTVEIDQPCCRFIPHVLVARAGQKLVIKNSAPIAHNANFASDENGNFNKLIEPGKKYELPKPLVMEPNSITVACNLHTWMKASIRIFDHPYFAITDADGKFTIKNAPTGAFDIFYWHPANGWLGAREGRNGYPINIKGAVMDLGKKEMEKNP
jgi:hypothetical protein